MEQRRRSATRNRNKSRTTSRQVYMSRSNWETASGEEHIAGVASLCSADRILKATACFCIAHARLLRPFGVRAAHHEKSVPYPRLLHSQNEIRLSCSPSDLPHLVMGMSTAVPVVLVGTSLDFCVTARLPDLQPGTRALAMIACVAHVCPWHDKGRPWHDRGRPWHGRGRPWHDRGRPWHDRGRPWHDRGRFWHDRGRFWHDRGRFWHDKG
eukprot:40950-Pleurochrysis_carterae.AAC.1